MTEKVKSCLKPLNKITEEYTLLFDTLQKEREERFLSEKQQLEKLNELTTQLSLLKHYSESRDTLIKEREEQNKMYALLREEYFLLKDEYNQYRVFIDATIDKIKEHIKFLDEE